MVKTSYGIALCRHNSEKNNQVEIVLIKKRYSYHYFSFIYGHYKKSNDKTLKYLFDNMSFSEKVDILGMQFDIMWYRIWLNNPDTRFNIRNIYPKTEEKLTDAEIRALYNKNKHRFNNNFGRSVKRLQNLIHSSSNSEIMWEIPKGGKNANETDIDCAIREFYEETTIKPNRYQILHNIPPIIESHRDNDVEYKNVYYVARELDNLKPDPKLDFSNYKQISEVEQVKWVSLNEIHFMSLNSAMHKKLMDLYKNVIWHYKKGVKNSVINL